MSLPVNETILETYFGNYVTDCISTQTQKKTNEYTSKEYQSDDFQTKQRPPEELSSETALSGI